MIGVAKRNKGKNKAKVVVRHLYAHYLENAPKGNTVYNVKNTIYTNILQDFNEALMALIIEKNFEYKLPYRLGSLRIRSRATKLSLKEDGSLDTKRIPVDWKATKKMWTDNPELHKLKKLVFITNEHTDGNAAGFYWMKKTAVVKNIYYRSFIVSRANKRRLAEVIKDPNIKVKYYG